MKYPRFLWLFLIAFLPGLSAAEPPPRVFRVLGMDGNIPALLYDQGSHKGIPISTYQGSFSPEYAAPSGGTLSLYHLVEPPADAPPGTKPTKEVLAEIDYPKDIARAILVLYTSAANSHFPISGRVIDDPVDGHKTGMARIFNFSSLLVACSLSDQVVYAQPRSQNVTMPFSSGSCIVKVAAEVGRDWRLVLEWQRNLFANQRVFVILVDAPPPSEDAPPVACSFVYDTVRSPVPPVKHDSASP